LQSIPARRSAWKHHDETPTSQNLSWLG
jgi:hypothetical protein